MKLKTSVNHRIFLYGIFFNYETIPKKGMIKYLKYKGMTERLTRSSVVKNELMIEFFSLVLT